MNESFLEQMKQLHIALLDRFQEGKNVQAKDIQRMIPLFQIMAQSVAILDKRLAMGQIGYQALFVDNMKKSLEQLYQCAIEEEKRKFYTVNVIPSLLEVDLSLN